MDIDYDQFHSAESAAIAHKSGGTSSYPDVNCTRGVKIMTSRCPDIDKEEIYIAALTTTSRTVEFRNLFSKETKNSTAQSIADSSAEVRDGLDSSWQEEVGEDYIVNAFGKKRKKKTVQ